MPLIRRNAAGILYFTMKVVWVWIGAFLLFWFFRNFGIENSRHFELVGERTIDLEIFITVLAGVLIGVIYSGIELFFDRAYFQKISFGKIILLKTAFYFISIKVVFFLIILVYVWQSDMELNNEIILEAMRSDNFMAVLVYFIIVSALISFVLEVSQKFGPGMLWKFSIGKYHRPQEEERIFLFIDLRSSTTIAEELGHIKFSRLIQDCFFDMSDVISKHQADVYQYVGDEAILSWVNQKGITRNRCLHAYFDYMKVLDNKKDYYLKTYGLQPFFKAGIHLGKVTVAEVGVAKKEIAYHGDVLNTTARIQAQCNLLGQALLASDEIIRSIPSNQEFNYHLIQEATLLRGKQKPVKIYGVEPVLSS